VSRDVDPPPITDCRRGRGRGRGARSPRRSLVELPTVAAPPPPPPPVASSPSCSDSSEIVAETENAANDDVAAATACVPPADRPPAHGRNESAAAEHLSSAAENQLAVEVGHVTMTSYVDKRDRGAAESCGDGEIVWTARHDDADEGRVRRNNAPAKNDEVAGTGAKSARAMADRWRRAATSRFAANRRFAHLPH